MIVLDTSVLSAAFRRSSTTRADHLRAAEIHRACAAAGFAVTSADALVAALASHRGSTLFSLDRDFDRISRATGLHLHVW